MDIRELYLGSNRTLNYIARKYKCNPGTIRAILKRSQYEHFEFRPRGRKPDIILDTDDKNDIFVQYNVHGESLRSIARIYNTDHKRIKRVIEAFG